MQLLVSPLADRQYSFTAIAEDLTGSLSPADTQATITNAWAVALPGASTGAQPSTPVAAPWTPPRLAEVGLTLSGQPGEGAGASVSPPVKPNKVLVYPASPTGTGGDTLID